MRAYHIQHQDNFVDKGGRGDLCDGKDVDDGFQLGEDECSDELGEGNGLAIAAGGENRYVRPQQGDPEPLQYSGLSGRVVLTVNLGCACLGPHDFHFNLFPGTPISGLIEARHALEQCLEPFVTGNPLTQVGGSCIMSVCPHQDVSVVARAI